MHEMRSPHYYHRLLSSASKYTNMVSESDKRILDARTTHAVIGFNADMSIPSKKLSQPARHCQFEQ